jgi:flagellar M-ring protein FliF
MDSVIQIFRSLGPARLAVIGGVLIAVIAFFVVMLTRLSAPEYALLYGDLDMQDSGRIVQQLKATSVPYELRNNGTAIYVAKQHVDATRVQLADQGLPSGGSVGYELFDKSDALGTTNFMQNVNLVRALEGELSRTIRSIDTVQAARVHLVMPKRELFSRQREEPTASIVLKMHGNKRLSHNQVQAVQHLVASAVPGLLPARISVVDDRGTLLAGGFEADNAIINSNDRAEQRRIQFENRTAKAVEELLEKTVGQGKVRAEVHADMNFDRINTQEEIFDPESQVVRSVQSVEEASSNSDGSGPLPVSVATNLPDADFDRGGHGGRSATEQRNEETINYEISKKIINHVREAGIVNRLSVAVLVDGTYGPGDDGPETYRPRAQEELDLLATLVRSATGFSAERGDTVEVINMPFATAAGFASDEAALMLGLDRGDLLQLAQYIALIIFALLVILLVVRPLLTRALESLPVPATGLGGPLLTRGPETPALAAPLGREVQTVPGSGERTPIRAELEDTIDLDQVEGRVRASAMHQVSGLVDSHPEEAIAIIRKWLREDS